MSPIGLLWCRCWRRYGRAWVTSPRSGRRSRAQGRLCLCGWSRDLSRRSRPASRVSRTRWCGRFQWRRPALPSQPDSVNSSVTDSVHTCGVVGVDPRDTCRGRWGGPCTGTSCAPSKGSMGEPFPALRPAVRHRSSRLRVPGSGRRGGRHLHRDICHVGRLKQVGVHAHRRVCGCSRTSYPGVCAASDVNRPTPLRIFGSGDVTGGGVGLWSWYAPATTTIVRGSVDVSYTTTAPGTSVYLKARTTAQNFDNLPRRYESTGDGANTWAIPGNTATSMGLAMRSNDKRTYGDKWANTLQIKQFTIVLSDSTAPTAVGERRAHNRPMAQRRPAGVPVRHRQRRRRGRRGDRVGRLDGAHDRLLRGAEAERDPARRCESSCAPCARRSRISARASTSSRLSRATRPAW